jgi:hypothetical protein
MYKLVSSSTDNDLAPATSPSVRLPLNPAVYCYC